MRESRQRPAFGVRTESGAPGRTTVSVVGEVDIATSPRLEDELISAIERGEGPVDVDLAQVTFFGAAGITALLAARRFADTHTAPMVVTSASAPVARLLELTDLAGHFGLGDIDARGVHTLSTPGS